jgi:hypothetical protein
MPQITMFRAQPLSPPYTLQIALDTLDTVIVLNTDEGILAAPGILILGSDTDAPEVVQYQPFVANQAAITRGIEGEPKVWAAGTLVLNGLAAVTINNMIDNITDNAGGIAGAVAHGNITTGNPHNLSSNDIGLGNVVNIDTSNATNITTGTLPGAQVPLATETQKGGIKIRDNGAGTFFITTNGANP